MLTKFTVTAFKSLDRVEVELGQVNVFIGPNGSGKSSFLEALGVVGAAAFGRVDDEALLRRGVRPGVPQLYKSSFMGNKPAAEIRFHAEAGKASYDVGMFNPSDDPQPAWRFHTEKLLVDGKKLVGRSHRNLDKSNPEAGLAALKLYNMPSDSPAARLLELLRNYGIYCPNTPTLRGLIPDPQQREPVGLSGGRLPEAVSELLRRNKGDSALRRVASDIFSLIDWASSFGAADAAAMPLSPAVATSHRVLRFRDRFMEDGRNILTGYDASEGALYVLYTAVLVLHEKAPRLVAIDNADHGLNPRLVRRLMELICRWVLAANSGKQLLMTSHNPLVLDGLPLLDNRVRLFSVDRDNQGKTVVTRVRVTEELTAKAKEGWTLSRLWVRGDIGGVPNV